MDLFNVEGGGLPVMEVDRGASDEGRLVFVRRPRRSCGVTVAVLGAAVFVGACVLAVGTGHPRERMALLALGAFVAVAGAILGVVVATSRYRLIVDREAGFLISSWWFLGIENRTRKAIGEPRSVNWIREVEQSGDSMSGYRETVKFPVLLHYQDGQTRRMQRLFVGGREEDARRLARELGAFLGVDVDREGRES